MPGFKHILRDPNFYAENFNTPLTPQEEEQFQQWMMGESNRLGRDLSYDLEGYDLRGNWLGGAIRGANGHGSDSATVDTGPDSSYRDLLGDLEADRGAIIRPKKTDRGIKAEPFRFPNRYGGPF